VSKLGESCFDNKSSNSAFQNESNVLRFNTELKVQLKHDAADNVFANSTSKPANEKTLENRGTPMKSSYFSLTAASFSATKLCLPSQSNCDRQINLASSQVKQRPFKEQTNSQLMDRGSVVSFSNQDSKSSNFQSNAETMYQVNDLSQTRLELPRVHNHFQTSFKDKEICTSVEDCEDNEDSHMSAECVSKATAKEMTSASPFINLSFSNSNQ
jgi:hypothetical protein